MPKLDEIPALVSPEVTSLMVTLFENELEVHEPSSVSTNYVPSWFTESVAPLDTNTDVGGLVSLYQLYVRDG